MRESPHRTASRDERERQARAELEVAASVLMNRIHGDRDESQANPAFAASVRDADADLWALVDSRGPRHEAPREGRAS